MSMAVNPASLDLPRKPGVYLFKRADGRVQYVGKATNLRTRVGSYFAAKQKREKVPKLVAESDDVEYIVTQNPSEALILERQLIRKHKPRYNSMLMDDKSYPFIAFTGHEHPRIIYTRHPPKDSQRWGPFPDAGSAKQVIRLIRSQFGIRDCPELLPSGCLAMHIGLCHGPCIEPDGYDQQVRAARSVLDGDAGILIETLQEEMDEASAELDYESAAQKRNLIQAVNTTLSQQVIHSRFYQDCDAVGFASIGEVAVVLILHTQDGVIQGQVSYPVLHRGDVETSVSLVLSEHYANRRPPKTLLVPTPLSNSMSEWLSERCGKNVTIRNPQRGELAKLRGMADANAEIQAARQSTKRSGSLEQAAADQAAKVHELESLDHIVCFDMAQIQGKEKVGAAIVFRNGRPSKKEYRTYRVKTEVEDDLRMMQEIVERWLKRQQEWPDLLLLDGGETHLKHVHAMLTTHGLGDRFPIAALAKKEETLWRPGADPVMLDRKSRVLVYARDEAHRFVNAFHRKRRSKGGLKSPLEDVEGLGAKKIQSLLRHFGGMKGIEHATEAQLAATPGIGRSLAERIFSHLNG
ncbi:MAG: excinuclease ABC subunit UvrC [Candidatus Thermoplasmatota archaeon]|nr:excinuclease ABC subunit UvrC [Candidatus Thermoplasmatota archaeon]MED6312795.1 excinuclease ABC subunit UvrC [Candidatus Thermoplasmatota archaeon]MEE3304396.1 excinuclease ABC subunit UvrC [Candidatus Thermoplasmatota archaeon]